jgi:hypothetical protein
VSCATALLTWKLDAADVSRMAGHANYRTTLDMYVKAQPPASSTAPAPPPSNHARPDEGLEVSVSIGASTPLGASAPSGRAR